MLVSCLGNAGGSQKETCSFLGDKDFIEKRHCRSSLGASQPDGMRDAAGVAIRLRPSLKLCALLRATSGIKRILPVATGGESYSGVCLGPFRGLAFS